MLHTDHIRDGTERTTDENVTITVPDGVVDAIVERLDAHEDPDEDVAHDLALDHVDMSHRLVTEAGVPVETAALERIGEADADREELVDVPLDEDTIAAVDAAAERAGEDRLEWIRRAAGDRLEDDHAADGVELTFDEDGAHARDVENPAPVDVEATAELDYAADPDRPLSIELEIPAGVIDEDDLDDVLAAVSIDARIADE